MADRILPIWDNSPQVSADVPDGYIDYLVQTANRTIYNGRAYRRPDTGTVDIAINSICAPYLRVPFPTGASPEEAYGFEPAPGMKRHFEFIRIGGSDTVDVDFGVDFYADWSYDPKRALTSDAAAPVTGEVSRRQVVLASIYNPPEDGIPVAVTTAQGQTSFRIPASVGQPGVAWVGLASGYETATAITIGTTRYRILDDCTRYALYYRNAYGGWDSLLVQGALKEANNYTRATGKRAYTLSPDMGPVAPPRGTVNFLNSYTKSFECTTGWLSDEQAARMEQIFGSVDVYLCDLCEDRFMPVVLTDKTFEYKTFRNQGAQLVNYTIKMQAAIEYTRQ